MIICILFMSLNSTIIKADNITEDERSTWIWNPWILVDNEINTLEFLETKHINKVYLQIDYEISKKVYQSFIEKATAKDIQIYALAGESYWITENGIEYQNQLMDWLEHYQHEATDVQRFLGIHLDIEPYDTTLWTTKQTTAIQTYQQLVVQAKKKAQSFNLPLQLDIPFWYDEISYDTKYGNGILSEWLIDHSDGVTIMAYRDNSQEIIKIAKNEIEYAKQMNKKVVVGVETLESKEGESISFSEEGEAYMNRQLSKVQKYFSKKTSFKGIAIHHLESWMEMRP
ncbi:amidase [Lysinibacillus pakistanensis]|uniref:Amidase n=2 Tax=Lysinibacillus pakistanensis TaxID=759811 RepID=A0ABX6DE66_9BACI|nr:amidase [Lysinibacillus pakistanensis]